MQKILLQFSRALRSVAIPHSTRRCTLLATFSVLLRQTWPTPAVEMLALCMAARYCQSGHYETFLQVQKSPRFRLSPRATEIPPQPRLSLFCLPQWRIWELSLVVGKLFPSFWSLLFNLEIWISLSEVIEARGGILKLDLLVPGCKKPLPIMLHIGSKLIQRCRSLKALQVSSSFAKRRKDLKFASRRHLDQIPVMFALKLIKCPRTMDIYY